MSQGGTTCRRILTWADFDNDGLVGSSERIEFRSTPFVLSRLCPYLGGNAVLYCNSTNADAITPDDITADPNLTGCLGLTRKTCAQNEATNIINWIRGCPGTTCNGTGRSRAITDPVDDVGCLVLRARSEEHTSELQSLAYLV